jgi:predicted secreted protein
LKRDKKIVLLAHCILNVNAKVYGLATEPAGCKQIVTGLLNSGFGIIQLPCVEQSCFGINRWGQVKNQLNFPSFQNKCQSLLKPIVEQVLDFYENGYEIVSVIGIDGSPACGVNYTCTGNWGGEIGKGYDLAMRIASLSILQEKGVMMKIFQEMLEEEGIDVRFVAVDENNPDTAGEEFISKLID